MQWLCHDSGRQSPASHARWLPARVGFVVSNMALGEYFLRVRLFAPDIFPRMMNNNFVYYEWQYLESTLYSDFLPSRHHVLATPVLFYAHKLRKATF
jgi:hypothetical protein